MAEYLLLAGTVLGYMLIPVVMAWLFSIAPVPRARVARFARRQRLTITPDNGERVIRYLATIRRWRAGGLVVGFQVFVGLPLLVDSWLLNDFGVATYEILDSPGQPVLMFLSGWFVGALIAEARLARTNFRTHRVASLAPRDASAYLGRTGRAALPLAVTASLAVAAVTAVRVARGGPVDVPRFLAWTAIALVVAAVVWRVHRQVLHRPQPPLPPDQLAADDAIRSRSLHVLAGAGAAVVGYAVLGQLSALWATQQTTAMRWLVVTALVVLVPLLGHHVATSRWSVTRQPVPAPTLS